ISLRGGVLDPPSKSLTTGKTNFMTTAQLNELILKVLDDLKGQNIVSLDVRELTDVMDTLIIVSGTSNRHVKAMVDNVVEEAKGAGFRPLGVEGKDGSEWVLVDFGDTVV